MATSWINAFLVCSGLVYVVNANYGKMIGDFGVTSNGVSGTVYAANSETIVIVGFTFDGSTSDAVILIGKTEIPTADGTEVPIVQLGRAVSSLAEYNDGLLVLSIPGNESLSAYRYIAVWNREHQGESYGFVAIPDSFVPPTAYSLGVLTGEYHEFAASNVIILDSKTFRFIGVTYDGKGPSAFFWAGTTDVPDENGTRLIWKNTASRQIQRLFQSEIIDVTLPGNLTVADVKYIAMWCEKAVLSFGHISIPEDVAALNVPPASEMIRIYDNCEVLSEGELQVRWSIKGDVIEVQLSGKSSPNTFMGFGLSGSSSVSHLGPSDVTVAWVNNQMQPMVIDYYYHQSQLQCSEGVGVCPDTVVKPNAGTNDVALTAYSRMGGVTRISYSRYLDTGDAIDKVIPTDKPVFIVWAIGPVQDEDKVLYNRDSTKTSSLKRINFGRSANDECPSFDLPTDNTMNEQPAWPTLVLKDRQQFRVDIGPSGGSRGYKAITGKPAWYVAWYVDGLLVPVIKMKRGTTYIINVFGGNDPTDLENYHPFYLTSSPTGAIVNYPRRRKAGPLCRYTDDGSIAYDFNNFEEYKMHLKRDCSDSVVGGRLVWTPDSATPDTVYYQCYTHFGMGFRIELSSTATSFTTSAAMVTGLLLITTLK